MSETKFPANSFLGALQVGMALATAPLSRLWYNRSGATADEVRRALPGDDLVPEPKIGYTRAITIDRPPRDVWPWLAQIGQGRGGLYSYDGLENLVGCDIHSVDKIIPEFQELEVGDKVRFGPEDKKMPGQVVAAIDPGRSLVMYGLNPETGEADKSATWAFVLEEIDGEGTRLITRQRLTYEGVGASILWHIVEPLNYVMERKMLLGIKARAESLSAG